MIIAVEPQCTGFEHERFNAALLATLARALPEERIAFFSEVGHGRCVEACAARAGYALPLEGGRNLDLDWSRNAHVRLGQEERLCRDVLAAARREGARSVVFCSVTAATLISLKRLLERGEYEGPVAAVPHAILADTRKRTRRLWNRGIDIVSALRMPSPRNLRLVALSRSIAAAMATAFPDNDWHSLDHPYLFGSRGPAPHAVRRELHIGIFGALRHRLEDYLEVVRGALAGGAPVRFSLLGHIGGDGEAARRLRDAIPGAGQRPLAAEVFDQVGPSIDYSLNISDPAYHRLVASATLLDSFNYLAPVLSLDNALFDEYRGAMGDVGRSFTSLRELAEAIGELAADFPAGQHREQVETIARERERFSPPRLSDSLLPVVRA